MLFRVCCENNGKNATSMTLGVKMGGKYKVASQIFTEILPSLNSLCGTIYNKTSRAMKLMNEKNLLLKLETLRLIIIIQEKI